MQEYFATPKDKSLPIPIDRAFLDLKGLLLEIARDVVRRRKRNATDIVDRIIEPRTDRGWEKLEKPLAVRQPVPGGTIWHQT